MTFIGIDVSKAWLDIYVDTTRQYKRIGNQDGAFVELVAAFTALTPQRILLEATGGV